MIFVTRGGDPLNEKDLAQLRGREVTPQEREIIFHGCTQEDLTRYILRLNLASLITATFEPADMSFSVVLDGGHDNKLWLNEKRLKAMKCVLCSRAKNTTTPEADAKSMQYVQQLLGVIHFNRHPSQLQTTIPSLKSATQRQLTVYQL